VVEGPPYENVRSRTSIAPCRPSTEIGVPAGATSVTRGTVSSTSSMRIHDAMPRCIRFVTQPNAIIGQASPIR
jgi:hypothetical protein